MVPRAVPRGGLQKVVFTARALMVQSERESAPVLVAETHNPTKVLHCFGRIIDDLSSTQLKMSGQRATGTGIHRNTLKCNVKSGI